jgi:hypothetical protein
MSSLSGPRATSEQPSLSADVLDEIDAASLEIRARVMDTLARERGETISTDDVDRAVRTALPEVLSRLATFRFTQGGRRHRSQFVRRFVIASVIAVGITVGVLIFTQEESATGLASSSVASLLTAVAALVGAALGYYFGNEDLPQAELRSRAGTSLEAQLLQEHKELEARAAAATQAPQDTTTVSQLITLLTERGYWDARAAQQFRESLRTRNALVHPGTDRPVDPAEIDRALGVVRELKHQIPSPA